MEKTLTEIEDELRRFIENELDKQESLDISTYGNPNARPKDKTVWRNVQQEKDRLLAAYNGPIPAKTLKGKLEHVINQLSSWF